MIAPEEMEKECEAIIEYEEKAVIMLSFLESAIAKCDQIEPREELRNQTPLPIPVQSQTPTPSTQAVMSEVKLKPIELKKFNGRFEEWLPFWEQYKVAVHENDSMSSAMKFNYLSNSLEGKAAAAIAGYLPTAECYDEVIKALTSEYGNNEKLIEKYIQKLVNIKAVTMSSDIRGLRALYNEISSTIRTLSALKIEASQYGLMIKSILLTSIPTNMRINFYKTTDQNSDATGNIETLLKFIKNEIEAIEKAQLSEKDNKEQKKPEQRKGTATSLVTNCEGQSQRQNIFCVFCKNNNHNTKTCKGKLSVSERKEILKREGRCYRCAKRSHTSKFCKAQWVKCEECNGRHLTSLSEKHREKSNEKQTVQSPTATLNTLQCEETAIYLQTAKAIALNTKESKQILTRIIMDNGSQRTFVTESLKNEMKLKKCGNRSIRIMSFGNNAKENCKNYEVVELKLKNQYDVKIITINAVVVPNICEDILPSVEKFNINENLKLADINKSGGRILGGINLLIGQDNYWQFNSEQCKTLSTNLVAVKTFFGWTIQGCKDINKQLSCVLNINEQIEETFNVAKFWDLEAIGINNNNFEHNVAKIGIRWTAWKNSLSSLNDNKLIALKRLSVLTIKLINKNLIEEYDAQIKELLKNEYAEKIAEKSSENDRVYYMPHMAVYRNDKITSRVRIVFDASSSEPGLLSLNDHLDSGEDIWLFF